MYQYRIEFSTKQTHFFYEAFESKSDVKAFKEMIADEEDIEDFLKDYVYADPEFITPTFETSRLTIYDEKGRELDSFADDELKKKQISRRAFELNDPRKTLRGYILFIEVLDTDTTISLKTKELYNRKNFSIELIDNRYKISPKKYDYEQACYIEYNGDSLDLSGLGDGFGTSDLKVVLFDDSGKKLLIDLEKPDRLKAILQKLC
jgi:hypothetical protein